MKDTVKRIALQIARSTAYLYLLTMVLFSIGTYIDGFIIHPSQIMKLILMCIVLSCITCFRKSCERKQWMLRLSYPMKRLLFAPFYLAVALVTVLNFGDQLQNTTEKIIAVCSGFTTVFVISGFIMYVVRLRKVENYNHALEKFQKHLNEEEL